MGFQGNPPPFGLKSKYYIGTCVDTIRIYNKLEIVVIRQK